MSFKSTITWFFLSLFVSMSALVWNFQAPSARVVFLRGNDLVSANADGSDVKVLVTDNARKADPRWSPDRKRIVYRVEGDKNRNPQTHAKLIVITSDGSSLRSIQVLATESDGTLVGGMRFVEESGWLSETALYAVGSVNPSTAEYRMIDATTGNVIDSYFGTRFVTCAAMKKVAYVTTARAQSETRSQVEVNGTAIYTSPGNRDALIDHLQWSGDCNRLVFTVTSGTERRFIVIRGATSEAEIPLRAEMLDPLTIISDEQSFLLKGARDALYYDLTTRSLRANPAVVSKINQTRLNRETVLKRLGGTSPDW